MASPPEYYEFDDLLGTGGETAEAHGTLCGLLCGSTEDLPDSWIANTLADRHEGPGNAPVDAAAALVPLYETTRAALQGDEMAFGPFLPPDSADLESRLAALAAWCQGFLYGLALRGLRDLEDIDGEIREFLEDLVQISRVEPDEEDDPDGAEAAYCELVEYVRVGAQLLFDETRPATRPVEKSVS